MTVFPCGVVTRLLFQKQNKNYLHSFQEYFPFFQFPLVILKFLPEHCWSAWQIMCRSKPASVYCSLCPQDSPCWGWAGVQPNSLQHCRDSPTPHAKSSWCNPFFHPAAQTASVCFDLDHHTMDHSCEPGCLFQPWPVIQPSVNWWSQWRSVYCCFWTGGNAATEAWSTSWYHYYFSRYNKFNILPVQA